MVAVFGFAADRGLSVTAAVACGTTAAAARAGPALDDLFRELVRFPFLGIGRATHTQVGAGHTVGEQPLDELIARGPDDVLERIMRGRWRRRTRLWRVAF